MLKESERRPVLIAGPTASGKSELALRLAERDGGVVINADASQVYACWRVLTARPDDADVARAPHRLYGHVDPRRRYSAGDWRRDALAAIAEARGLGLRPIIVGGTGLYFSALVDGLAEIPPIPAEVRRLSMALLAGGLDTMRADLARDDPVTLARIDAANPMRVQRAWDVLTATGRGLAWWQDHAASGGIGAAVRLVVLPDAAATSANITRRLERMLALGALDEVRGFLRLGVPGDLPAARVIGAAEFADHILGRTSLAEATAATAAATRRLAKRQRTWLRGRMADWTPVDPGTAAALDSVE